MVSFHGLWVSGYVGRWVGVRWGSGPGLIFIFYLKNIIVGVLVFVRSCKHPGGRLAGDAPAFGQHQQVHCREGKIGAGEGRERGGRLR